MRIFKSLVLSALLACSASAVDAANSKKKNAKKNSSFKVPQEFSVDVYAESDLVANPVSIAFDAKGRMYVAEVHRFRRGVEDSRQYNKWFLDEIKIHSLQGRLDLYKKWTEKGLFKEGHFTEYSDKITTIIDTDGDGKADKSFMYADGFNEALTGNAGSILVGQDGEMYYANIPYIWKLTDEDGDGISDEREKMFSGFGFRNGVNGHDLHGLEWGVDGRLYFSNGDRGYSVTTKEGNVLKDSERGAIYRCEPDGSNLELFTIGNRNPQDLAFDQYGNLFTVDNNRGRGDESRVCYLVELGDYGWNSGHENKTTFFRATKLHERKGPKPTDSWVVEGDWKQEFDGQAAYVIPPVFFIGGGSAGITFNPGESLGDKYSNKFMYSAYQRGIHAFNFVPDGAGLAMKETELFWNGGLIMDTEFDYDGKFYVADYVATNDYKDGKRKGAVYVLKNDDYLKKQSVLSAAKKLKAGFKNSSQDELYGNLFHKDMRVRLFSQFELVRRGKEGSKTLTKAITQTEDEVARLHGIWGIGQFSRKDKSYNKLLEKFIADKNWRVRANVAKVLGESQDPSYISTLSKLLGDKNSRVQFYSATALGKLGHKAEIVDALIKVAELNNDKDIYLRHSVVAGLIYTEANEEISKHLKSNSAAVRRVTLLALARLGDTKVAQLLSDKDVTIVQETIRAIDRMLDDKLTQSVGLALGKFSRGEPSLAMTDMERILQWSFRNGSLKAANNTASLVTNKQAPEKLRLIAMYDLLRWHEKLPMDPVIGQVRFINPDRADINALIKETIKTSLEDKSSEELASLIAGLSIEYGLAKNTNALAAKILNKNEPVERRVDILHKLVASKDESVGKILSHLVKEKNVVIKREVLLILNKINRKKYDKSIEEMISNQSDLKVLYSVIQATNDKKNVKAIENGLVNLNKGRHEGESLLELLNAAEAMNSPKIKNFLGKYKASKTANDDLFEYRSTMYGGDAQNGRKLIYEQGVGQCIICHKVEGKGGIVAPDLSNLASLKRSTSSYLVESLVHPSKYVVPGYGNLTVQLKDGNTVIASLISKDSKEVKVKMATGKVETYPASKVKSVSTPLSSMPPMGTVLSKKDLRDMIAYLKTLKEEKH